MSPPPDCVAVPDPMPSTQTWVWNADPQLRLPPNLQLWPLRLVGHFLFEKKSIFASRSEFDQISKMRNYKSRPSKSVWPFWRTLPRLRPSNSDTAVCHVRCLNNPKQSKTCVEYLDSDAIDIPIPLITCWYLMHWRVDKVHPAILSSMTGLTNSSSSLPHFPEAPPRRSWTFRAAASRLWAASTCWRTESFSCCSCWTCSTLHD